MAELPNAPPDLSQQYLAHRNQSADEAAYAQEMARLQSAGPAPRNGQAQSSAAPTASNAATGPDAGEPPQAATAAPAGAAPSAEGPAAAPAGPYKPDQEAVLAEMRRLIDERLAERAA